MIIERLPEIEKLSVEEKWVLVDELWAALLAEQSPEADPLLLAELENRMAHYQSHPETATTWEVLRARLQVSR